MWVVGMGTWWVWVWVQVLDTHTHTHTHSLKWVGTHGFSNEYTYLVFFGTISPYIH